MTVAGPIGVLAATGGETGREAVALGAALLVAGVLARAGRRFGLPTIPLFMAAGILTGPFTPGPVLVRDPADLGLLTTLGLILLLFHLGLEFSLDDLLAGGRKLLAAGAVYLAINLSSGMAVGTSFGGRGLVGRLLGTGDDELLTVCFVGVAVLVAGVASNVGVSDGIGAFLAGQVVAGTSVAHRVERLVLPLRDLFAAMFFFAFGLIVDPGAIGSVAGPVLLAVTVTIVGCVVAGVFAARIQGMGPYAAANIGLTVLARGEFSLILASLAVAAGLDGRISPFTAGYVLVLAIAGPLAASRSHLLAGGIPARLFPAP